MLPEIRVPDARESAVRAPPSPGCRPPGAPLAGRRRGQWDADGPALSACGLYLTTPPPGPNPPTNLRALPLERRRIGMMPGLDSPSSRHHAPSLGPSGRRDTVPCRSPRRASMSRTAVPGAGRWRDSRATIDQGGAPSPLRCGGPVFGGCRGFLGVPSAFTVLLGSPRGAGPCSQLPGDRGLRGVPAGVLRWAARESPGRRRRSR